MGYVGVSLCDFCGKRTEKFSARMVLQGKNKNGALHTDRSWSSCKKCHQTIMSMQTYGDKIIEELEIKLDQIRSKDYHLEIFNTKENTQQ